MVVVVVPVHGAGGVGGALASPFGDGGDDGMVVQEEYSHTGKDSMRYVMGGIR